MFRRNPEILAEPNLLVLRIQPDEGMSLSSGKLRVGGRIKPWRWSSTYGKAFGGEPPEGYERSCWTR